LHCPGITIEDVRKSDLLAELTDSCQTVFPKICGYYLLASIITLGASTLAKNATKPNPCEIKPLQTTRKDNNWKTEEALARAAVTVETERIKGSNP